MYVGVYKCQRDDILYALTYINITKDKYNLLGILVTLFNNLKIVKERNVGCYCG